MAVDWGGSEQKLYEASVAAIRRFGEEHPQVSVCFFAFDSEPRYGYVLVSFDTLENNIRSAKQREQFAVERRQKMLTRADSWQSAKYFLRTPVLTAFNTNSGGFAFREYARVTFPEWRELGKQGEYPGKANQQDDYLESNVRLVLWRVAERLVVGQEFKSLKLASPFMVGYGIHDQEEVILRLLNWPSSAVPGTTSDQPRE